MPCEKYSGWMTDAALGELRADCAPELLAHVAECDACREALSDARAVHDFVDRGVESLVAGEPSPHFATNLRRSIAQESQPLRSPWMAWAPVIASALALTAILAIMVARRPVHNPSNPKVVAAVHTVSAPPAAVNASAANPQSTERTARTRDSRRSVRARAATATLPEIIVPQGQLAAAVQLSASINSGRVDANQLLAAREEYEKPLEVKPMEIAPMEIPALDVPTENPAGSLQF